MLGSALLSVVGLVSVIGGDPLPHAAQAQGRAEAVAGSDSALGPIGVPAPAHAHARNAGEAGWEPAGQVGVVPSGYRQPEPAPFELDAAADPQEAAAYASYRARAAAMGDSATSAAALELDGATEPQHVQQVSERDGEIYLPLVGQYAREDLASPSPVAGGPTAGIRSRYTDGNAVGDLAFHDASNTLFTSSVNSVSRWNIETNTYTTYSIADGLIAVPIRELEVDSAGNAWILSQNAMDVLMADGSGWRHYYPDNSELKIGQRITAFLIDDEDNKWISYYGAGVLRLSPDGEWSSWTTDNGLSSNKVAYTAVARDGTVWFAVDVALDRLSPDGTWASYQDVPWCHYEACHKPDSVAFDPHGDAWFSLSWSNFVPFGNGVVKPQLARLSVDSMTWTTYRDDAFDQGWSHITRLAIDADGRVYVGHKLISNMGSLRTRGGISVLLPGASTFTWMQDEALGHPASVFHIVIDGQGRKWLVTDRGVSELSADNTTWTSIKTTDYMPGNTVRTVEIGPQGEKWFGGPSGASRRAAKGAEGQEYNFWNSGLGSDHVQAIAIDSDGSTWFGAGDPISVGRDLGHYADDNLFYNNLGGRELSRVSPEGRWTEHALSPYDSWGFTVNDIEIDPFGNRWFATSYGIRQLSADGTWASRGLGMGRLAARWSDGSDETRLAESSFTTRLAEMGPIEGEMVLFEPEGSICALDLESLPDVAGRILQTKLYEGEYNSTCAARLVARAQEDGALAVVNVGTFPHSARAVSGLPLSDEATIPLVSISPGLGQPLRDRLAAGEFVTVRLEAAPGMPLRPRPRGALRWWVESFHSATVDRDGSVWFGSQGEIIERSPDDRWTSHYAGIDLMATTPVQAGVAMEDGELWFGTPDGALLRGEDGVWTTFSDVVGHVSATWPGGALEGPYRQGLAGPQLGVSGPVEGPMVAWSGEGCDTGACAQDLRGKIALIDAAEPTPVNQQLTDAQSAGAAAVVVFAARDSFGSPIIDADRGAVAIPNVMIDRQLGLALRDQLADKHPVQVHLDARRNALGSLRARVGDAVTEIDQLEGHIGPSLAMLGGLEGDMAWFGPACAGAPAAQVVADKIALVAYDDGCSFAIQVLEAQLAGARAVVFVGGGQGLTPPGGGVTPEALAIPSVMVEEAAGTHLRDQLLAGVRITVQLEPSPDWHPFSGPARRAVNAVERDRKGNVLFGTNDGVFVRSADGTQWSTQLLGTPINSIAVDPTNGEAWVGTAGYGAVRISEVEPGESAETAVQLDTSTQTESQIGHAADIDVYRVEVGQPFSRLEFNLWDPDDRLELTLHRCDSSSAAAGGRHIAGGHHIAGGRHIAGGCRYLAGARPDGKEQRLVYDVTSRIGTYYLAVAAKPGARSFPIDYRLRSGLTEIDLHEKLTLIITHEPAIRARFSLDEHSQDLADWRVALMELESDAAVKGVLVDDLEHLPFPNSTTDDAVWTSYQNWEKAVKLHPEDSTRRANLFAKALREWIAERKRTDMPYLQYVVLVGDDRIVPHYRVAIEPAVAERNDGWVTENTYLDEPAPSIPADTTVGTALLDDMTLSDDIYGSFASVPWGDTDLEDLDLDLPRLAVGRLVEEPAEMTAAINAFLDTRGILSLSDTLVAGYDFMQDGPEVADLYLHNAGLPDARRRRLLEEEWSAPEAPELRDLLFDGVFDLKFLAAHATHYVYNTPSREDVDAAAVASASDRVGQLVYTLACHAGLNVPGRFNTDDPDDPVYEELDFPQAWLGKGATYIGSTGWAYGLDGELLYQEDMMADFTRLLVDGDGMAVGDALAEAKRAYYWDIANLNHFNAKTIAGTILYGLPMVRARIEAPELPDSDDPTPGADPVIMRGDLEAKGEGTAVRKLRASIDRSLLDLKRTDKGSYFRIGDWRTRAEAGEPVQPGFGETVFEERLPGVREGEDQKLPPRGVVWLGGRYRDVTSFDPLVRQACRMGLAQDLCPEAERFEAPGWFPSMPVALRTLPHGAEGSTVLVGQSEGRLLYTVGQFDPETSTERLFETIDVDVYFSASADELPPVIQSVATPSGAARDLAVTATDAGGVARVVATYTDGTGTWRSIELGDADGDRTWHGELLADVIFLIQVVDTAGNVTLDDNDGAFYVDE